MSDALSIPAGRCAWVFTITGNPQDLGEPDAEGSWPGMETALGITGLDGSNVHLVNAQQMGAGGLRGYLTGLLRLDKRAIKRDAARLDGLPDPVLIVLAHALPIEAKALSPSGDLTLVDRYDAQRPMSQARVQGMVATAALGLMLAYIGVIMLMS